MNTLFVLLVPIFIGIGFFTGNYSIAIGGIFMVGASSMMLSMVDTFSDESTDAADQKDPVAQAFKSLDQTGQDLNHYLNHINWTVIGEVTFAVIALIGITLFGRFLWKNHRDKKIAYLKSLETSLHKRLELDSILMQLLRQRGIISETKPSTT